MDKIVVTEEQAKAIKEIVDKEVMYKHDTAHLIAEELKEVHNYLDLVTIARIVEGEEYEVKREFKVGDILVNSVNQVVIVRSVNPIYISSYICGGEPFKLNLNYNYRLLVKSENREDLQ